MIDVGRTIKQDDINAYKQRTNLSGTMDDANPLVSMDNARFAMYICTAIDKGLIRAEKGIKF